MKFITPTLKLLLAFVIFSNSAKAINNYPVSQGIIENSILQSDDERLIIIKELLNEGNTKQALEKLYQFIDEVEKVGNTKLFIEGNMLVADIFRDNGDYIKSNIHFNKIVPLVKLNYENLQLIYFKKGGNFQNEGQIDSAQVNYEKSILASEKIADKFDLKAKVHANLSGIYYLKENYKKAIEHSKIAANYQEILGNKEIEAGILNNLGSIYYMTGDYKKALTTFENALSLVGYGQEELQKRTRSTSYINIAYAYGGLNNFEKAFEFQDRYFSLSDSLNQELKYKEIAEIESKYKVEAKAKEAEIERGKRKEAEFLTYGLGIALVVLLFGIYILYKMYKLSKRNYALQMNQEQLMHQNKIEKLKSDSQAKILAATLDGRLEERKSIASVLHDNVSALLSAANLHLYASKKHLKDKSPIEIDKSQDILQEASEQIRNLSHKLISSVLLKFGLNVAVQDLCEKSSNSTINLTSESKNIERFNQNFEIKIFSIISELVNNILKHSKAKNGMIKLEQLNGNLQIIVFDDGQGFDTNAIEEKSGVGISHVEARIKVLNGLININSTSQGTRIFMSIPIVY